MDRRAKLQLRLPQAVEGLSLAAIVYVIGLVAYATKAGKTGGLAVEPELLTGLAIPVVALTVLLLLRRVRRRLHWTDDDSTGRNYGRKGSYPNFS